MFDAPYAFNYFQFVLRIAIMLTDKHLGWCKEPGDVSREWSAQWSPQFKLEIEARSRLLLNLNATFMRDENSDWT